MTSFRILVSAYACEPNKGSEPEVGWQWILQLARFNKVWVITRKNNQHKIDESNIRQKLPNLNFVYFDLPKSLIWWKKGNKGIHLYYLLWQIGATLLGYRLNKDLKFDICHHLTFSPLYQPPILSLLPIPFMWGPLGGGEKLPTTFLKMFKLKQVVREKIRRILRSSIYVNPFVLFALYRSNLLLASTKDTYYTIPKIFRKKTVLELQIGMESTCKSKNELEVGKKFKLITAGRHTYWKGQILIVKAFADILNTSSFDVELTILGRGEETKKIKDEVNRLGINDSVKFISFIPERSDVLSAFAEANVFVYASLLECAGYVVLEALAQGTPVICLDLPGPGDIVDSTCGIKVSCRNPEEAAGNLSKAIQQLIVDRDLWTDLSLGALQKVNKEHSWPIKGERLQEYLLHNFSPKNNSAQ